MKSFKIISALALISAMSLLAVGCDDGKLSVVGYNNEVVDALNTTSEMVEATTTAYDEIIPNIVTEDSEIDVTPLKTALNSASIQLDSATSVLDLMSRDLEQETTVKEEFTNYLELGESYLTTYKTMVTYYENNKFVENLDLVAEYDDQLHEEYNTFIESNNALVDILDSFVE